MVDKKPRIVIVGAGMAGLTAANKLYTSTGLSDMFELCVVEGGTRIGGRINTSEFCGDRIEMGATWIHGIGGSPVHQIAQEIGSLESEQPWEFMDGFSDDSISIIEGGFELSPSITNPISTLFKTLMNFAQGKESEDDGDCYSKLAAKAFQDCTSNCEGLNRVSVGSFLRRGLDLYWGSLNGEDEIEGFGNWSRILIEEAIFSAHENIQRTYASAGDLSTLDFNAESEYIMFPGKEITIAKGYSSIIQALASVLPPDLVQLGRKVAKIEWTCEGENMENEDYSKPVKLHFCDGSIIYADHVIVTVSLGVLKAGIDEDSGMFKPPLPCFKTIAISRLGFGVVNKLFLQWSPTHDRKGETFNKFPFFNMAFHRQDSEFRHKKIPWWMRRTASIFPLYQNSSVLLCWFAGEEAIKLESLNDEEIINGVSTTISSFLTPTHMPVKSNSTQLINPNVKPTKISTQIGVKFTKVLKSQWASDPLFLGSYSYVAVGSSGKDFDTMAEPLPRSSSSDSSTRFPLQILFAGEATHRTHYSTTHGAYFSGLREANRLLQHYQLGI